MNTRTVTKKTANMAASVRQSGFARSLMTTSCLTAACAASATAGTVIIEGTAPAPDDFGNKPAAAYLLPSGTTEVQGFLGEGDFSDYIAFQDLNPSTIYNLQVKGGGRRLQW